MMVTEEKALKMWCPFVRTVAFAPSAMGGISLMQSNSLGNRIAQEERVAPGVTCCVTDRCMMWRWAETAEWVSRADAEFKRTGRRIGYTHGYCGLASRPETMP